MPDDRAQAAEQTRRLRARFPRWGILFDPLESVWVAVRGRRTLVAASSPEMWRDICIANRDALLAELARYGTQLESIRALLAAGDEEVLRIGRTAARRAAPVPP